MNPIAWIFGLGLGALLALLGPLILSAILYRFLPNSVRRWVLIAATTCGIASVVWGMLEATGQPQGPMSVLVTFVMSFGVAALICSAIALFARFLIWLRHAAPVAHMVSRLRR
jgi:hypothetical protein